MSHEPKNGPEPQVSSRRHQALQERVSAAILDAAAHVIARTPDRASMTDVAAAAGVARATVYRYFPSRQALLEELSRVALADASARLAAARLDEVDLQDGVSAAVRALVDAGDAFIVLARGRLSSTDFDRAVVTPLRRLLDAALARDEIRSDIPPSWLTESLVGLVVAVASATPVVGREDTVAATASLFLHGAHARPRPVRAG
jgi:TetR/AcrR family transcriptional regulator, mexCD-oprJ operon repressor